MKTDMALNLLMLLLSLIAVIIAGISENYFALAIATVLVLLSAWIYNLRARY